MTSTIALTNQKGGVGKTTTAVNLGSMNLSGIEFKLADQVGRELILKKSLSPIADRYDYVLIDCPPSLGLLTVNALAFVKEVFIPLQTKVMALNGIVTLLDTVQVIKDRLNPSIEITGIIPCMFDIRTNLSKEVVDKIRGYFKEKVFKSIIRENVRLAEAPSFEKPITLYAPGSYGAEDYLALAKEVIKQEK